jgi:hypothetical protein
MLIAAAAAAPGGACRHCWAAALNETVVVTIDRRLAVVHVARQAALAQGLAEVAGVRRQHDLATVEAQPQR